MKNYIVRLISGGALHQPQRYSVTAQDSQIGEIGRAQTREKAQRLQQALEVLERYERGELIECGEPRLQVASD